MLPVRNVSKQDVVSPLLFNFALDYAIRRVQISQYGLNVSGKHQLLVYADNVSLLGESVHTIQKNAEALVVASKETGIEVNADKAKCMVTSRHQDLRLSPLKGWKEFRYLGTTLTNQNSIREEIKS
jgi:hypothetical protein